jgi:2,3-bisphosphoglycerate-dependent phosphoglycerate mutase
VQDRLRRGENIDGMNQPVIAEAHRQTRWIAPAGTTHVLLLRHGATVGLVGEGDRFPTIDGHGDPRLSQDGELQAQFTADRLSNEPIDAIYVTTLTRTHQTAAPLVAKLGIQPKIEPELREVFLGEWEGGLTRVFAAQGDPRYLRAVEEGEWGHIPGAETTAQLTQRSMAALDRIVAAHAGQRVLCVVHGGVIAAVMRAVTGSAHDFGGADNCSISHIAHVGGKWRLRCFNDTAHLGGFAPSTHRPNATDHAAMGSSR